MAQLECAAVNCCRVQLVRRYVHVNNSTVPIRSTSNIERTKVFWNGGILVGRCNVTAAVAVPGNIKYPPVRLFIKQKKLRGNGIDHEKAPTDKRKKKDSRLV
jgi:hypothetical protein